MVPFFLLLAKDLRSIMRSRQFVAACGGFALLLVVVASFSFLQLGYSQSDLKAITPGIIWLIFLFTGVIALNNSFLLEKENDVLRGMLLLGVNPSAFYFAKFISSTIFICVIQAVVFVAHAVLFGVEIFDVILHWQLLTLLLAVGFAAVGSLLAAIAVCLRAREVVLPLTLYPVLLAPMYAVVELSRELLASGRLDTESFWFVMLCGYDVIAVTLGWLLFEFLVRE